MKTKQEQIVEMEKIIKSEYEQWLDTTGVIPKASTYYAECLGCTIDCAEALYNSGYRKIDKDSVVLSRKEYEMLANQYKNLEIKYSNLCDKYRLCKDANETLKQNVITARKETAKEIEQFKTSNQNAIDKINELQKEINALQEENRRLDEYVSCTLSAQEFDEEIKQAKIDVLNELKRQAEHCDQWNCEVVPTRYIDEMIEEVEE